MAKIYFICGFIGSGKTTYSEQLSKHKKAIVFSPDERMISMFGEHMERELFDSHLESFKRSFKELAIKLIGLQVSVVFDFGFWTKADREEIAKWAASHGLDYEFIYLIVPYEVCHRRVMSRNQASGIKSYEMMAEMLELFWSRFEPPTPDEQVTFIELR